MLQSIGDFAVNIIPTVDKASFNKGIAFLGNLGNTTKLLDFGAALGKSFTGLLTDTADATSEMYLFAKSLDLPIGKVEQLRRAFILSGTSADVADSSMQGLLKTVQGFKYGEGNFEMLGKAGITPQMFSGDPLKDIEMLANRFSKMNAAQRQYFISGAGLSPDALRYLSLEKKERQNILNIAQSTGLATEKQGKDSFKLVQSMAETEQRWTSFKRSLVSETLPEVTKALGALNRIMENKDFIDVMRGLTQVLSAFVGFFGASVEKTAESITGMKTIGASTDRPRLSGYALSPFGYMPTKEDLDKLHKNQNTQSSVTVNVNATGLGTKEAADMIADKVKNTLKEENKNQIDMQQTVFNY